MKYLLLSAFCIIAVSLWAAELSLDKAMEIGTVKRSNWTQAPSIDFEQVQNAGISVYKGRHLTLFSDATGNIDALISTFDFAVPLWTNFFGIPQELTKDWHIIGCLIDDFDKFKKTNLVDAVPNLRNGFSIRKRIWLRNLDAGYYRTHLLLHEGVHAFMNHFFGGCGPIWLMEGLAEHLATHRYENGELKIAIMPKTRQETPMLGRIKYIREAVNNNDIKSISDVLTLSPVDFKENEAYAWSWAFAVFCDSHPDARKTLRELPIDIFLPGKHPSETFLSHFDEKTLISLENNWLDFVKNIEYGYDFQRTLIADFQKGENAGTSPAANVRADSGWQNSRICVLKEKKYRIEANGLFTMATEPKEWISDPNGVTIKYYRNRPTGLLIAAVLSDATGLLGKPFPIGNGCDWLCGESGTLFFRINDSPAELFDNSGSVKINITNLPER